MEKAFKIDLIGDDSGIQRNGDFEIKLTLSFLENFEKDKVRRELLGDTNGSPAADDAFLYSVIFSELRVRLVKAPEWWTENANGMKLKDQNVVDEVWLQTKKLLDKFNEVKAAKKAAAQADLKAEAPKL